MDQKKMRRQLRRLRQEYRLSSVLASWQARVAAWRLPAFSRSRWFLGGAYLAVILLACAAWIGVLNTRLGGPVGKDVDPHQPILFAGYGHDLAPRSPAEGQRPTLWQLAFASQESDQSTAALPEDEPAEPEQAATSQPDPNPPLEQPSQPPPAAEPATAALTLGRLEYPVEGQIVNSYELSMKWKTFNDWRPHQALDFAASEGTPIGAAAKGTVQKIISDDMMWGTVITIDHGGGWTTTYSNVAEPAVSVGQQVAAKQIIGNVGPNPPAESLDVSHLHFSLFENGKAVDPRSKLR
jgi:murein DD-endopeptidase MepM/ murein hydrolase activator NlpD